MTKEEQETTQHYLNVIGTEGRNLTKWEEDFVDSVREQFKTNKHLSARQVEILERIYSEKTP